MGESNTTPIQPMAARVSFLYITMWAEATVIKPSDTNVMMCGHQS